MIEALYAVLAGALLFTAFVVPLSFRKSTSRRQLFERQSDIFFQKVEALTGDPDTPIEMLRLIDGMNDLVAWNHAGFLVLRLFLRRPSPDQLAAADREYDAVVGPFFQRRPELARAYAAMVISWTQAVLANADGVTGWVSRRLLRSTISLVDPELLAKRVSAEKARRKRHHDNGNHHTPAQAAAA